MYVVLVPHFNLCNMDGGEIKRLYDNCIERFYSDKIPMNEKIEHLSNLLENIISYLQIIIVQQIGLPRTSLYESGNTPQKKQKLSSNKEKIIQHNSKELITQIEKCETILIKFSKVLKGS